MKTYEKYLTEKLPPQFVYDKVRKMRKQGMTDNEISKKLKIPLNTIRGIK